MNTLTSFPSRTNASGSDASSETRNFDDYVWLDETVEPVEEGDAVPDMKPVGGFKSESGSRHPPPPLTLRARAAAQRIPTIEVRGEPERARDLMTRQILTVAPSDPILMLQEHMNAFRFHHLPVVDGDVLMGVINYADVLEASSSRLSKSAPEENAILHRLPASRIMRRDVVTVRPDEPLDRVAELLWATRAGCVLVTEEEGTLVGIITEGDFLRLTHHFLVMTSPAHADAH